ncbi:DUF7335 family protein, partial [Klebsiella pneumoniae]
MDVKEIANTIMELWQMDGYRCAEPPLYESTLNHTRTYTALIVSIN